MHKIYLVLATTAVVIGSADMSFELIAQAAIGPLDVRTSLTALESVRDQNQKSFRDIETQLADADAKLARWQPFLENSTRLQNWMYSAEGRQYLRNFEAKPDSRNVRELLALRVSAIEVKREILASNAESVSANLVENQLEIVRLKKAIQLTDDLAPKPQNTEAEAHAQSPTPPSI